MFSLSKESERDLTDKIGSVVEQYLKAREKPKPRLIGLISAKDTMDELGVKYNTLQRWEKVGLKRYQPPLEDTRKVYYKVTDILKFMGAEE